MLLDSKDKGFEKFCLWQDKNGNGLSEEGELWSLKEIGILSIDLKQVKKSSAEHQSKGIGILNTGEVHWEDGKTTTAYDLVLEYYVY